MQANRNIHDIYSRNIHVTAAEIVVVVIQWFYTLGGGLCIGLNNQVGLKNEGPVFTKKFLH